MSHPMLASSASLTQLTVTTTPYKAQPLRPPLLSFDGYAGELLVSHHASSPTVPAFQRQTQPSPMRPAHRPTPRGPAGGGL